MLIQTMVDVGDEIIVVGIRLFFFERSDNVLSFGLLLFLSERKGPLFIRYGMTKI